MGRRWYQNVDIEGVEFEDPARKDSKFWNEGKWAHFIAPLLPEQRETFIEIGCNAGLFLKMATEAGFHRVIGVEADSRIMAQAQAFKRHAKGDWQLVHQKVGKNFVLDELPLADVTLISSAHYYFPIGAFSNLVDHLKSRTLCCLVVAAKARRLSGRAKYDLGSVRGYFRDWREIKVMEGLDMEDDPAPRRRMYGVSFKGNLDAWDIKNTYNLYRWQALRSDKFKKHGLSPALEEFFKKVLSGVTFELKDTPLYRYWETMGYGPEAILGKLEYKKKLAEDVQANGMKEPIYYDRHGKLLDGIHRLVIAKELGYKHILVRCL